MKHSDKLTRDETITSVLAAISDALGSDEPHEQSLRIIQTIRAMRDEGIRIASPAMDYLRHVQELSRRAPGSPASIRTPLGFLTATASPKAWRGKMGIRTAWVTEYALDGAPITLKEIRAAGLAQRPFTRSRRKAK